MSRTDIPQMGEWAVVVGGGLNALGVARSLATKRVKVASFTKGRRSLLQHSKFPQRHFGDADYSVLPQRLLEIARELGGRPVLFLTEEESVREVSRARDQMSDAYRFRLAPHETMLRLTHKEGVQTLAEQHGLRIPRAVRLCSENDLEALDRLRFPCVLKPGLKDYGYGARFKKAYVVQSPEEARKLFAEIAPTLPDLVVQEWIEGGDDSVYFCLQYIGEDGKAVASFTGRKLRSWPPQVGGTASCMAAPDVDQELGAMTQKFFDAVGFRGMGSMEYKRDERDGQFYAVEPTVGRTDFQQEVATINGNNLPFAAYCYECGFPVAQPRPTAPTIWREPTTDRWSQQEQGSHPAFSAHKVVDAYWRLNDPGPWLSMTHSRVRQRLRALFR